MSQPTPKADQLRALREAKFNKRGKDAQTSGATRKGVRDNCGGVPAVAQHLRPAAAKVGNAAVKGKGKVRGIAKGKKQAARKRKPAGR